MMSKVGTACCAALIAGLIGSVSACSPAASGHPSAKGTPVASDHSSL